MCTGSVGIWCTINETCHVVIFFKASKGNRDTQIINKLFSETDIKMLELRLRTFLLCFSTDIPMGTNFAPILADLFLYSYEAVIMQGLLKKKEKKTFNFPFRYIDNVLSVNNSKFDYCIYPLSLKYITVTANSASYSDLHLVGYSEYQLLCSNQHSMTS